MSYGRLIAFRCCAEESVVEKFEGLWVYKQERNTRSPERKHLAACNFVKAATKRIIYGGGDTGSHFTMSEDRCAITSFI